MADLSLSSNVWYQMTEYRVNWTYTLQMKDESPWMGDPPDTALDRWQVLAVGDGTYQIRNNLVGPSKQLSVCFAADEVDGSRTQPCMAPSSGSDSQRWRINPWGDGNGLYGSFYLQNVANGTDYNLDCHQGTPLFMGSSHQANSELAVAQHWLFSSVTDINNSAYSTAYTGTVVPATQSIITSVSRPPSAATRTPSAATTTSPVSTSTGVGAIAQPVETNPTSHDPAGNLPSGTKVAIGVGCGLGILLIVCVTLLAVLYKRKFFENRRFQLHEAPDTELQRSPRPFMYPAPYTPPLPLPAYSPGAHGNQQTEHMGAYMDLSTHHDLESPPLELSQTIEKRSELPTPQHKDDPQPQTIQSPRELDGEEVYRVVLRMSIPPDQKHRRFFNW